MNSFPVKKLIIFFLIAVLMITVVFLFTIFYSEKIKAPVHISAEPLSYNEIFVSWEEDEEISHYNVYRATDQSNSYIKIDYTKKGEYIDKDLMPSTVYYYKVTKVVNYEESDYSSRASVSTKPVMPTGLKATSEDFQETMRLQVNLDWNYSFVADNYNIYRSSQEEGPYEKIGTSSVESYADNDIEQETVYYYTITQVTNNIESVYSDVVEVLTSEEWVCGDIINYGGKDYETVIIGSNCWFNENLDISEEDVQYDCSVKRSCYRGDCDIYGGQYDFTSASCNQKKEGTRGICPVGWRIPTDDDWANLEISIGMDEEEVNTYGFRGSNEASKISDGYELWYPGELREDKDFSTSSFNILPGGFCEWKRRRAGEGVAFWSSTPSEGDADCRRHGYRVRILKYDNNKIMLNCFVSDYKAYIRCARSL
ncbi:MAG: FISUMP domain-containing protein [Patescibacteria group bacterium]|nr:FISUMP domain-containing protein [Patescibacteria group bacterium]